MAGIFVNPTITSMGGGKIIEDNEDIVGYTDIENLDMDATKLLYLYIKNENATLEITFDNGAKKTISINASATSDNLFLYFGAIDFVERYRNVASSSDKEQDYGFIFFQNYRTSDIYINNWGAKDLLYNKSSIIVDNTEKYYSLTPLKIKHIKCNRKVNGIILVKKIY